ncbi:hypothetical protein LA76x_2670 [Lysobacter antibioticus]|uniref:Uncharacterized protein n=1 Tax=Lysobacter antibioticus TaxID=84531 RepID=A0A0S2FBA3_LYSAN|nr:hypothetical protein LA76x_2670 [Lysobacter antibioticus]
MVRREDDHLTGVRKSSAQAAKRPQNRAAGPQSRSFADAGIGVAGFKAAGPGNDT